MKLVIGVLVCIVITPFSIIKAQEKIITKSNDEINGEVKVLGQNVLKIDPDYGENVFEIDWDEIQNFESERTFIIILSSNERLTGVITTRGMEVGKIQVTTEEEVRVLNIIDIVELNSVNKTFWERIGISIDGGYSLTKANNNSQLSLGGNVNYLTEKTLTDLNFSIVNSTVQDSIKTKRTNANIAFRWFFKGATFAIFKVDILQSDEQSLDLRTTTQIGIGYSIINNNKMLFAAAGGAALNNENFQDETIENNDSGELFATLDFRAFDLGDLSINASSTAYPSMTEKDRIRVNFNVDFKWDLPLEFYFKVGYNHSFDSKPIAGAPKNDYVFQASVGWEL